MKKLSVVRIQESGFSRSKNSKKKEWIPAFAGMTNNTKQNKQNNKKTTSRSLCSLW